MFKTIKKQPRLLMEAELTPIQGERFQPTGFPDIGAAIYELPDGTRKILVESAQSVANRMEKVCLDGEGPAISEELKGLPYIEVELIGTEGLVVSSLVEAHRINSPFIINNKEFKEDFTEKCGYSRGKPIDWKKVGKTILYYDPLSLIHGAFMANLEDGRIKFPRALTGFIEAENIREVSYGGVKNNPFDPKGVIRTAENPKNVYGNVPYHRTEYTAEKTTAFFNLDIALLKGYHLPEEALDLLIAISLFKIRKFLSTGLRLRTACDYRTVGDIKVTNIEEFIIPSEDELLNKIKTLIKACAGKKLFPEIPVTRLKTKTVLKTD